MVTIQVKKILQAPINLVSQTLLEHQQLDRFFKAKFTLVKNENKGELLGGKGAIRQISIGKITFSEKIINASNEHICYQIIGDKPVSNHQGDIQLTPVGIESMCTNIDYVIRFTCPPWLPSFLVKFFVERDINNAIKKLAQHFSSGHLT